HLKRLDLDIEKEIQIVVVASLAGGTGAGAFLDMGFMCRSLQDPKPKAVNLVAIAGGAFSGLNDRVLANTYASCMELEYCMNASAGQPYVESWTDAVRCESVRPFNDVCFIDSKNLVDQSTGNRDFLFNMVADCLFVDLHDEALRGKRREDQVNQAQYKIEPYHPPMPAGIEANAMTFSRAYSSMGQVVLDTSARLDFEREIVSSSIEMVEAFFRIASSDKNNAPKPEDIDGFLKNQLSINSERLFDRFPDFIKTNKPSMPDFPLVDRLLYSRQVDLVARVKESVSKDINNIPTVQPDLDQWPARVSEIYENHRRSIIADVQSSAQDASLEQAIKTERRNLLEKLRDREQGLRKTVYMFLDSQERGGLYFTAGLIQAVQDRIEVTCDRLKTCSGQFDNIAQRIYNDYYTTAHANLQRSIKGGLFGRADERQALVYLEQISSSLSYLIEFMMRARACDEAIALLREVAEDLGHGSALGEGTNTGATGIMKEIEEGRATVRTMVSDLKQEVRLLDDARTSSNPFHTFVKGRRLGEIEVNQKDIAEWGARALGQYGGSQVLFQQLRDEKDRVGIINTLRGIAREEMRREEEKIQPVQSVLRDLDRTNRLRLFSEAVANALPWVNMDVERLGGDAFDSKSLSVFVAVENVAEFRREFDDELKTALPARFQSKDIYYIDSGVRGRVVVFTELSGIPLHSLRPMHDDWRSAYEKRST
ncbi:MAG: tubulin-like doman-containing protein, partial [Nitratireductor sp.]